MNLGDISYVFNGRTCSTCEEITKITEKARNQAFVAAAKLGYDIKPSTSLNLFLKSPIVEFADSISKNYRNETLNGNEFKQIIIGDKVAYVKMSSEWKKVYFVNVVNTGSLLLNSMMNPNACNIRDYFLHNYCRLINSNHLFNSLTREEQLNVLQTYELQRTSEDIIIVYGNKCDREEDLNLNEILQHFHETNMTLSERNEIMRKFFEHSIWFKLFYHSRQLLESLSDKQKRNLISLFQENFSIIDKLKLFGYSLLLLDTENIDYYSFKIAQDIYKYPNPENMQANMAAEFCASSFAAHVTQACEENKVLSNRSRMQYTARFSK